MDRAYSSEVGAVPTQLMARLQMQYARSSFLHNLHNMFEPVFEKESDMCNGSKVSLVSAANGLQVWRTGTSTNWVTMWDNSSGTQQQLSLALSFYTLYCVSIFTSLHLYTLTITHSHTLLITCTCCCDESKGTQDKDFSYSFSDSLSPSI